jgi:hypothetical protein
MKYWKLLRFYLLASRYCVKEGHHIPNIASMTADQDFFVRSQYSKYRNWATTYWSEHEVQMTIFLILTYLIASKPKRQKNE